VTCFGGVVVENVTGWGDNERGKGKRNCKAKSSYMAVQVT